MLILSITYGNGEGMEIAFAGTDGDGDICSSPCRTLMGSKGRHGAICR